MKVTVPCPCPPSAAGAPRHEAGDEVTLREPLDFRTRLALRQTIRWEKERHADVTDGELLAALTEAYCLHCIDAWTLLDEKGKAVPPSRENIRQLLEEHDETAMAIADAADSLYAPVVLLPLLLGASSSFPATSTNGSTSQRKAGRTPQQKHSKRSSTSTTPTAVTAATP